MAAQALKNPKEGMGGGGRRDFETSLFNHEIYPTDFIPVVFDKFCRLFGKNLQLARITVPILLLRQAESI